MSSDREFNFGPDPDLQVQDGTQLRPPSMYRVILHNDHYTTMEFVVDILVRSSTSRPPKPSASCSTSTAGSGVCGVYSYDIARTKVSQVLALARTQEFPLHCTVEEA